MARRVSFEGHHPFARRGARARQRTGGILGRLDAFIKEWRRTLRHVRAEAEITRKLAHHDEHLLRDMGLVRVGERLEPADPERTPWR